MSYRVVPTIFPAALLVGCSTSDTLTIPTGNNWTAIADKLPVEVVHYRQASLDTNVTPAAPNAMQKSLSMSGAIGIRQWLAALGAQHGLSLRPATASELRSGYTDAIARDNGPAILLKENTTSTQLTVHVTGPANAETKQIASAIRQQFGPVATTPDNSIEALRRDYGLPGRAEKR